ncbi:hypothetical protein NDU88_007430 [Pleurodeles waltl]|uniref:Uncharacterized protein n=1 Tax=Pleurodeles waltl TaxID=8319 RepID=A0AAV7U0N2_PLEWA|nr:hypothetical protein NDU88_007430 [Pleurodeles waltl]
MRGPVWEDRVGAPADTGRLRRRETARETTKWHSRSQGQSAQKPTHAQEPQLPEEEVRHATSSLPLLHGSRLPSWPGEGTPNRNQGWKRTSSCQRRAQGQDHATSETASPKKEPNKARGPRTAPGSHTGPTDGRENKGPPSSPRESNSGTAPVSPADWTERTRNNSRPSPAGTTSSHPFTPLEDREKNRPNAG